MQRYGLIRIHVLLSDPMYSYTQRMHSVRSFLIRSYEVLSVMAKKFGGFSGLSCLAFRILPEVCPKFVWFAPLSPTNNFGLSFLAFWVLSEVCLVYAPPPSHAHNLFYELYFLCEWTLAVCCIQCAGDARGTDILPVCSKISFLKPDL